MMTFGSRTRKLAVIGVLGLALTACPEDGTAPEPGVEDPGTPNGLGETPNDTTTP